MEFSFWLANSRFFLVKSGGFVAVAANARFFSSCLSLNVDQSSLEIVDPNRMACSLDIFVALHHIELLESIVVLSADHPDVFFWGL